MVMTRMLLMELDALIWDVPCFMCQSCESFQLWRGVIQSLGLLSRLPLPWGGASTPSVPVPCLFLLLLLLLVLCPSPSSASRMRSSLGVQPLVRVQPSASAPPVLHLSRHQLQPQTQRPAPVQAGLSARRAVPPARTRLHQTPARSLPLHPQPSFCCAAVGRLQPREGTQSA